MAIQVRPAYRQSCYLCFSIACRSTWVTWQVSSALTSALSPPVQLPEVRLTALSPYTDQDINKLESAQRRVARLVTRDYRYTSSVSAMLRNLNWRTLDQRRIDSGLVLLYKVTYDLVAIPASDYLIRNTRLSSRIHPLAYRQITILKDYYKYTYFPRTIIHWNALPHHIPILPTLAQFSIAVCQVVHSVPLIPATVFIF